MKQPSQDLDLKDLLRSDSFFSQFLTFFEKIPCASYFLVNLSEEKVLHASAALVNLLGYPLDHLKEDGLGIFMGNVHSEDKPLVRQSFKEQKELFLREEGGTLSVRKYYVRMQLPKARFGHFEVYTSIFTLDEGSPLIMLGMVKDVTEVHLKSEYLLDILSDYIEGNEMEGVRLKLNEIRESSEEKHLKEINEHFHQYKWLKNRLKQLSDRELQVLQLIAEGLSSKELAERLNISSHTATSHRKNLMNKFKVRNTAELIKEASKVFSFN